MMHCKIYDAALCRRCHLIKQDLLLVDDVILSNTCAVPEKVDFTSLKFERGMLLFNSRTDWRSVTLPHDARRN
jgi:hypothetical protein